MAIDAAFEGTIVRATGRGVSEAVSVLFEEIYERHVGDVFHYALVLTRDRDEADDVTAETFARALRGWRNGSEPEGPPLRGC